MAKISEAELDIAIKLAADMWMEKETAEFMDLDTAGIKVSPAVEKRVLRAIRKEQSKETRQLYTKIAKAAVIVLISSVTMFFALTMSIDAVRKAFIDAIVTWYEEYIEVRFDSEEDIPEFEVMNPEYIPDEYSMVDEFYDTLFYSREFANKKGDYICYTQTKDIKSGTFIDNENCTKEKVYINDTQEAHLFTYKDGYHVLIWESKFVYYMITASSIDSDELIKMAESIK